MRKIKAIIWILRLINIIVYKLKMEHNITVD